MAVEKEAKIKIIPCIVCGKEYNKYTRPWGVYRNTCSEECKKIQKENIKKEYAENMQQGREIRRERTKIKLIVGLIISLITGGIGAVVGTNWGIQGALIGFAIGFFATPVLYFLWNN